MSQCCADLSSSAHCSCPIGLAGPDVAAWAPSLCVLITRREELNTTAKLRGHRSRDNLLLPGSQTQLYREWRKGTEREKGDIFLLLIHSIHLCRIWRNDLTTNRCEWAEGNIHCKWNQGSCNSELSKRILSVNWASLRVCSTHDQNGRGRETIWRRVIFSHCYMCSKGYFSETSHCLWSCSCPSKLHMVERQTGG